MRKLDHKETDKAELVPPLYCWDFFSMHLNSLATEGNKQLELAALRQYQNRHHWHVDLHEILASPYEALVLTDAGICIEWVSSGFTKMTGYAKKEALGKSPAMLLQGENTTRMSKDRVRRKLSSHDAFSEDLVNYRKCGEEYICRVEIHPLFNQKNELSHYLALEQEVK